MDIYKKSFRIPTRMDIPQCPGHRLTSRHWLCITGLIVSITSVASRFMEVSSNTTQYRGPAKRMVIFTLHMKVQSIQNGPIHMLRSIQNVCIKSLYLPRSTESSQVPACHYYAWMEVFRCP